MKAEIYTKPNCKFCDKAKALMIKNGIEYEEIDAPMHLGVLKARVMSAIGSEPRSVPQIFIDGEYVGGFDQLAEKLK